VVSVLSEKTPPRRDRADRQRNREHLLEVARTAFAEADDNDSSVSMDGIARAAGVGIATLYRHFPTRDQLAEAVYISKLDELTSRPSDAATDTGAMALRRWIGRYAAFMLSKRSMMDTVRAGWSSSTSTESEIWRRISGAIAVHLDRGAADGSLRADLQPDDVTAAILGLLTASSSQDEGTQARRLLDLLVDGMTPMSK
jgi:AcrR family transcriptional regulator